MSRNGLFGGAGSGGEAAMSKQCPNAALMTVAILLFAFFSSSASPAFAKKPYPEDRLALHGATFFVAPNGSDSGPGTADQPWATINNAAERAQPGDTVLVRGGRYVLAAQVRPHNSGRPGSWITFAGYPGEDPILDASLVPNSSYVQHGLVNGAFQIEDVSYVRVVNLTVINSHDVGFNIRDSSNIELIN